MSFFDTVKPKMIIEIQEILEQNVRFSVVLDEWSSITKYIFVMPSEKVFNLGLV